MSALDAVKEAMRKCVGEGSVLSDDRILDTLARAALSSQSLSLSEAREALRHYADTFCELGTDHECCGKLNDDQCSGCRARKALENGPAVLADATSNPPLSDLSSLRKGAEVEYRLLTKSDVVQAGDEVLADDTVSWLPATGWEIGMNYSPAIFVPVRRALVSGSREDGDG